MSLHQVMNPLKKTNLKFIQLLNSWRKPECIKVYCKRWLPGLQCKTRYQHTMAV